MGGDIFAIGGHEAKEGDRQILEAVVASMPRGKLVVVTVASEQPDEMYGGYEAVFADLGVEELVRLDVHNGENVLDGAGGVFFTGGDQLKITDRLHDTPVEHAIRDAWTSGAVIAGTSAVASAMSETMLVRGPVEESARVGDARLAPGLGYLPRVIIDQHFAERGRIGRLLGATAANPRLLGLGIDENTAVCARGEELIVLGVGAVTVIDAAGVTRTNVAESSDDPLSMFDVSLHLLSASDRFDLVARRPLPKETG